MTKINPLSIRTPIRDDFPRVEWLDRTNARAFVELTLAELLKASPEINGTIQIGVVVPIKVNRDKPSDIVMRDNWIRDLNVEAKDKPIEFYPVNDILLSNVRRARASFFNEDGYTPSIAFANRSFADRTKQKPFYVMCDDYYHHAGTFAALHHVIQQHGGHTLAAAAEQMGGLFGGANGDFAKNKFQIKMFDEILTDNGKIKGKQTIGARRYQVDVVLGRNFLSIDTLTGDEFSTFVAKGVVQHTEKTKNGVIFCNKSGDFQPLIDNIRMLIPEAASSEDVYRYSLQGIRAETLSERSRQIFDLE